MNRQTYSNADNVFAPLNSHTTYMRSNPEKVAATYPNRLFYISIYSAVGVVEMKVTQSPYSVTF